MKNRFNRFLLPVTLFMGVFLPALLSSETSVFRIPKIEGLTIDGSGIDWEERGFRVEILTGPDGKTLPADDFDVRFRLAWDAKGLYMLALVQDDAGVEHESLSGLWRSDCLEISIAEDVGHANRYMIVVAPGADPKFGTLRKREYDWRPEEENRSPLTFEIASRKTEAGYAVEFLFPWENLGIQPRSGSTIGFQVVANDDDGQTQTFRASWFPEISPADSTKMHNLLLSENPSEAVLFHLKREIDESEYRLSLQGTREMIGKEVMARCGDGDVTEIKFTDKAGRGHAFFSWKKEENIDMWPPVRIEASGKVLAEYEEIPTLDRLIANYTRAVGGQAAFESLSTRSCKGQYKLIGRGVFRLEAYASRPDKWTLHIANTEAAEKTGYDGTIGWKQGADRIDRADHLSRSILGWWLNPQGPVLLYEYFPRMRLTKKADRDGMPVIELDSISPQGGAKRTLEFDAVTGLLWRIDKHVRFEDYREVDGILFPHRVIIGRGEQTIDIDLDEVKHGVAIDDRVFAMPAVGDVFPEAFAGIEDEKVLPMLKMEGLSYRHGEMNVPCRDGRFMCDLIVENEYKRGLEIGTFNGYSTLWFGLAFRKTGGKVITVEIDPGPAREAQENFLRAGLTDVIDARINDAFDEIAKLDGEFDFIFIDANKEDYGRFFEMLKDRIKPGGALLGHNVTNSAREMKDFLDAIRNDPDFKTTFHPVSAEGISVSIKTPTLEQILNRYVETLGGRVAIEKLTSRVCRGRFIDDRPYAGPKQIIPFDALSKVPDKSLFILHHPDNTEWEGFDGSIRWRLDNNGLVRREDQERSQMDYFCDPQNALRIREYFPAMEMMGTVKLRGLSVYVVENSRKSPHYTLYFNAGNGLLVQIGYYEVHDYRDVDGVKFPFRLEYSRKGGSNSYVFDEVRHNVPVEDDRFSMPSKKDGGKFSERS
jgi:caffeoyl-CoA O-methyltransferase